MQITKALPEVLLIFLCVSPFFLLPVYSQDTVYLINPSFEDTPRKGGEFSVPIKGWHDCGISMFPGESPPDIHPTQKFAWQVSMPPLEGMTYLGLVVRYNDTYESLSQALPVPLKANTCYSFSAALAKSDAYVSATARSIRPESFTHAAILHIWGGNQFCRHAELLATTTPVDHSDWSYYDFIVRPKEDLKYITIEAYYDSHAFERYNGHIMVDALSPIIEINCE